MAGIRADLCSPLVRRIEGIEYTYPACVLDAFAKCKADRETIGALIIRMALL